MAIPPIWWKFRGALPPEITKQESKVVLIAFAVLLGVGLLLIFLFGGDANFSGVIP